MTMSDRRPLQRGESMTNPQPSASAPFDRAAYLLGLEEAARLLNDDANSLPRGVGPWFLRGAVVRICLRAGVLTAQQALAAYLALTDGDEFMRQRLGT